MFEKAFEPAKRFLSVIGASVGGLTAIFYGVGFLAVQAHHRFLGLTHLSVDFNQYLYNGGLFFAAFPNLTIYFWDSLLKIPASNFEWFLYALAVIVLIGLLLRIKLIRNLVNSLSIILKKLAIRNISVLQIVFNLVLLILFLSFSLQIADQNNILFTDINDTYSWLIDTTRESSNHRQQHFAQLLGIAIFSIFTHALLEHWRLHSNAKSGDQVKISWRSIFSLSALLLIILQLLYLPVNYGILLIPKTYPTVEFGLRNNQVDGIPPLSYPLIFVHREGDDYYFYSRENKKIWQIRRADMTWLIRTGEVNIFAQSLLHTDKGGDE